MAQPKKNFDASDIDVAPVKAKDSKLKLIIIILLAMLVGAGGAVAAKEFFNQPKTPVIETAETAKTKKGRQSAETPPGFPKIIELKPFVANLNDDGKGRRYLKMAISLEVEKPEQADEINAQMPKIRDAMLMLLSSLTYEDISTLDGKIRLRAQLLNRINNQLTSGKIKEIYFAEFIVQ